jgi:hypothetical protein
MENDVVLNEEQLFGDGSKPIVEPVTVARLGGKVLVSELDSRLAILVDQETHEPVPGGRGGRRIKVDGLYNARWLAATIRRPDGSRMFTINDGPEAGASLPPGVNVKPLFDPAQLDRLAKLPTPISEKLLEVALRLNSVDTGAVDAAAKN